MTLGTSPYPLGAALEESAAAEPRLRATEEKPWHRRHRVLVTLMRALFEHRILVLRAAAGLYLVTLAMLVTWSWGRSGELLPEGQMHIALLVLAGAVMAVASFGTERRAEPPARALASEPARPNLASLDDLLAQMNHELRTPLNAMIGFSEVMRHELHGPLNARYQEYVVHISESGGRMLKSSQDAIAVAEAMTALLSKVPEIRKERVPVARLVRQAWQTLGEGARLEVTCNGHEVLCEQHATAQALEHVLREAAQRSDGDGALHVTGIRDGATCSLLISADGAGAGSQRTAGTGSAPGGGMNLLLARLLLEAQGAKMVAGQRPSGAWFAEITFADRKAA